jgi:hypothetical protein
MRIFSISFGLFFASLTLAIVGCTSRPPEIISAGGIVTLNGAPLPHAEVRFFPKTEGLDMNFSSVGLTDAEGKFVLKMVGTDKAGVCVCSHHVTVTEGPLPPEARSNSENAQTIAVQFMQSLKNRPIPETYSNLVTSPIHVEVTKDQSEYSIQLSRN